PSGIGEHGGNADGARSAGDTTRRGPARRHRRAARADRPRRRRRRFSQAAAAAAPRRGSAPAARGEAPRGARDRGARQRGSVRRPPERGAGDRRRAPLTMRRAAPGRVVTGLTAGGGAPGYKGGASTLPMLATSLASAAT